MIYRSGLTFDPEKLRPALRISFARRKAQHLAIFLGEQRDLPVVEGPSLPIVRMDKEQLERMFPFHYYG